MIISDWINLSIAIFTFGGIIVSLWVAIKTLKQSSKQAEESREISEKMIEESTRPYLLLFIRPNNSVREYGRIVLKNFGNSPAKITYIKAPDISLTPGVTEEISRFRPFNNLEGVTFPPGYEVETVFHFDSHKETLYKMDIKYSSSHHQYEDNFEVKLGQNKGIPNIAESASEQEWELKTMTR